jgi:hypothetical protein
MTAPLSTFKGLDDNQKSAYQGYKRVVMDEISEMGLQIIKLELSV